MLRKACLQPTLVARPVGLLFDLEVTGWGVLGLCLLMALKPWPSGFLSSYYSSLAPTSCYLPAQALGNPPSGHKDLPGCNLTRLQEFLLTRGEAGASMMMSEHCGPVPTLTASFLALNCLLTGPGVGPSVTV